MTHRYQLTTLDKPHFLRHHWQKKPLVIRQGFKQFVDPIDENELAGLATDESIDSRVIRVEQGNWQVDHGPFEQFDSVCRGAWSLLVQSVDQYVPDVRQLLGQFNFIPSWRLDDMMVSYSVPGAGVGPHLDQYDVFIIQGKGSRRWQVGERGNYTAVRPAVDLQQISGFEPTIDEILETGDVLYIPAGCPHNGVATTSCINYSVGFRAPNQQELNSAFADYVCQHNHFTQRYTDRDLRLRSHSTLMLDEEKQRFKDMLIEMIDSTEFDDFMGFFFSQPIGEQRFDTDIDEQLSSEQVTKLLQQDVDFCPTETPKAISFVTPSKEQDQYLAWVNQEVFKCTQAELEDLEFLLSQQKFNQNNRNYQGNSLFFARVLSKLVNNGSWFPDY